MFFSELFLEGNISKVSVISLFDVSLINQNTAQQYVTQIQYIHCTQQRHILFKHTKYKARVQQLQLK